MTTTFQRRQHSMSHNKISESLMDELSFIAHNAEVYSAALAKPYQDKGMVINPNNDQLLQEIVCNLETAAAHLHAIMEREQ